jgi:L-lactate dehydrogenase complex protein LldG
VVAQGALVTTARDEILARVRRGLADVPAGEAPLDVSVPRAYRRSTEFGTTELTERFAATVDDYRATVRRVPLASLGREVAGECAQHGLRRVVVPPELPAEWRPDGVELVDDHGLSAPELDRLDGALTGCAAAIAQTGTLVLDGRGVSGRRAITLVPDHHICVVLAEQIVGIVPEAISRVAGAVRERHAPITLISGPSATSDIELTRVEGVHGPRNLVVLIAE